MGAHFVDCVQCVQVRIKCRVHVPHSFQPVTGCEPNVGQVKVPGFLHCPTLFCAPVRRYGLRNVHLSHAIGRRSGRRVLARRQAGGLGCAIPAERSPCCNSQDKSWFRSRRATCVSLLKSRRSGSLVPLARRPDSRDNVSTVGTAGYLILLSIAQASLIFASVGLLRILNLSWFYFYFSVLTAFSWEPSVLKWCVGCGCRDFVEIWMLVAVATSNFPDFWLH